MQMSPLELFQLLQAQKLQQEDLQEMVNRDAIAAIEKRGTDAQINNAIQALEIHNQEMINELWEVNPELAFELQRKELDAIAAFNKGFQSIIGDLK